MIAEIETIRRPIPTFSMLQAGRRGGVLATRAIRDFFGHENYDLFRRAGKTDEYILEEDKQKVDREVYDKVGVLVGNRRRSGEGIWNQAIVLSDRTFNYARRIHFEEQDRKATLITNVTSSDRRPSSALKILTTSSKFKGEQCRYDQGRQLVFALLCAEIIREEENSHSRPILDGITDILEKQFFTDKRSGDPKPHHVFSYHDPITNRLVGLSNQYPDSEFAESLWVKSLDFSVRTIGLRNSEGVGLDIKAQYEPRDKEIESGVIKAVQRSLKATKIRSNGGLIETAPYSNDKLGFELVVMGGHPLRDIVTANLEELFQAVGIDAMLPRDQVRPENGLSDRVQFRRRQFHITGLKKPLEVKIISLADYISSEYEVGVFNPDLGMHDGQAHDLYKLRIVSDVAEYLWPSSIYKIDLKNEKKKASYECATRLGRKQRIHPSPYEDFVA